jgi:predicted dehydrogenase
METRQPDPSAPPAVALVGCGYWGRNIARNLYQLGALRLVCDTSAGALAGVRAAHPGVRTARTVAAALKDPAVHAVAIAAPAVRHYALAKQVLLAGKDVFVEKPLALELREAEELVELARERRRVLMVGHLLEYHPAIRKLKELVDAGELGEIHHVYSNRLNLGKVRREENILWSFAPHDVAVILRLMGALPFQVVACGGAYLQPNIADVTVTHLLFDNGVRAHVHVSWLHPFKEQRLVVVGSRKMATFDDVAKQLVLYDQRFDIQDEQFVPMKGPGENVPFADHEPLRLECTAFLRAMASRQPPLTDGESGLQVLKVLQAAQRSLVMNGEPVELPLEINRRERQMALKSA